MNYNELVYGKAMKYSVQWFCVIHASCVLKELDAGASVSADWTVTSLSAEVLKFADKLPEGLQSVVEEDVRRADLLTSCLITMSRNSSIIGRSQIW